MDGSDCMLKKTDSAAKRAIPIIGGKRTVRRSLAACTNVDHFV